MEEESPVPMSGESSGVGTLTMSNEPTRSRSRSRSEEVGEVAPRPQADDPGGVGQEPFQAQIAMRELVEEEMLGGAINGSRPGPPRPNVQAPPPAVFEPGRHMFYLSPTGERYHTSHQCRGLRKASVTDVQVACRSSQDGSPEIESSIQWDQDVLSTGTTRIASQKCRRRN